jgi:rhamnose transport system substrate-binding protein/rhamnose transport system permease protein
VAAATLTVGVMPKSTGNPYFEDCHRGAVEAAEELGFTLRWDGPREPDAARQARIVERWVEEALPAIAVSVESRAQLTPALRDARSRGVRVLTWDADADPDAREFTVVPATPEAIGHALAFETGRITGGTGTVAALTSSLTAPNQNAWIAEFKARLAREHPGLALIEVRPTEDVQENARRETLSLLEGKPQLRAIVGLCSPAVPGAAEAVKQARRRDLHITGVSLPSLCRGYIEDGVVDSVVFWNTRNLGYLAAASAHALATGALEPGAAFLRAGRLGNVIVRGDEIRLGRCHIVTRGNLDSFQ